MANKHKHYDCIIAFANGEEIQYRPNSSYEWADSPYPTWDEDYEYRVKPKQTINPESLIGKVVKYKETASLALIVVANKIGVTIGREFYEYSRLNAEFENLDGTALI